MNLRGISRKSFCTWNSNRKLCFYVNFYRKFSLTQILTVKWFYVILTVNYSFYVNFNRKLILRNFYRSFYILRNIATESWILRKKLMRNIPR